MKIKLILLLAVLSVTAIANSQVIIRGGVNLANVTITNDGDIDNNKMITSFQIGIIGDLKIASSIYFQPGIVFTGKGSKTSAGKTTDPNYFVATSNPYYIEIPANFIFKTPTGKIKFFAGAGPYLAIGIAGKNKVDGKFLGIAFSSDKKIKWSNDDPSTLDYEEGSGYGIMKRFDYGLNGTAGIEFSKSVISINYGFGLAKIQSGSNSSADDKNKHRVLSITVGFKF